MKEENFASVTNIERVWFVDSDEAVYSKAPYSTTANFLTCSRTILFFFLTHFMWRTRIAGSLAAHTLGADHLTLEGGGGWGGVGDFEKNFLQALVGRKKLHAAEM